VLPRQQSALNHATAHTRGRWQQIIKETVLKYYLKINDMKNIKIIIILIVIFYSCSKDNDDIKPGYFIINYVDNNLKSSKTSFFQNSKQDDHFDLGEIKKSEEYHFTLSNGGDKPIFNISLNCSNTRFSIYPTSISILEAARKLNVQPLLKVRALHGKSLDGIGYAPLMDKGDNECILSIKGNTLSDNDTIEVKLDVYLNVFALVSDLIIHSQNDTIDLYTYEYYGSVVFKDSCKNSGLDKIRAYTYDKNNYKITNIGNVPLAISIFNRQDEIWWDIPIYNNYLTLGIGETSDYLGLPFCQDIDVFMFEVGFKVNTQGTITDINRLDYGDDGNIYFILTNFCEQ